MNSAHKKLFVRRSIRSKIKVYRDIESKYNRRIKSVAPINENMFLAGMAGKTSYDKLLEKDKAGSLYKELKPLLIVLTCLRKINRQTSKQSQYN
jgi:hypothetical protein